MPSMDDILGVILGGGRGQRLYPLTRDRAKPAVPIGGKYRLIDIPISNCINSGIFRIAVLTQFNSVSLHPALPSSIQSVTQMEMFSSPAAGPCGPEEGRSLPQLLVLINSTS